MKELTTQEKADRFDEAIERLRNAFYDNSGRMCEEYRKAVIRIIEPIFPELKESEDEIVRKWIIDYLNNRILNSSILDEKESCKKALAWLEKQEEQINLVNKEYWKGYREGKQEILDKYSEQKSADKVEPKFHEGEWITNGDYTWQIVMVKSLDYILQSQGGNIVEDTIFHVDEQFHSFTIQDAKDGDVLVSFFKYPFIYNGKFGETFVGAYCGLAVNDDFKECTRDCRWTYNKNIKLATKEQCDLLFQKMKESGYVWDAEKKELKKFEQKTVNKVEPKFKVGDWITDGNHFTIQIEAIKNNCYLYCGDCALYSTKIADKVYHLWTLADAKDGDVLADGNLPFIFKKIDANKYTYAYCGISVDDGFKIKSDGESGEWTWMQDIKPATKEQRDLLFQKMKEGGYEWDTYKKELKIIDWSKHIKYEPNSPSITKEHPTWGEEDEKNFNEVIPYIKKDAALRNYRISLKGKVHPQQEWSKEERQIIKDAACCILDCVNTAETKEEEERLEELADKLQDLRPQNNVTDEELAQAKKEAYNEALDKIEYHSGEPTFDDGWSAAIWYLKKRNGRPQTTWELSDEQIRVCKKVYADILSAKGFDLGTVNSELNRLEEELKKLK